jgi:hypothetical protein
MSVTKGKIHGNVILVQVDGTEIPVNGALIPTTEEVETTIKDAIGPNIRGTIDTPLDNGSSKIKCVIYMKRKNMVFVTNVENGQRGVFDLNKLSDKTIKASDMPLGTLITLHL